MILVVFKKCDFFGFFHTFCDFFEKVSSFFRLFGVKFKDILEGQRP